MITEKLTEIKETVESLGQLGKYIKPNGFDVPAIWVGSQPPLEYKVEGIEILIDYEVLSYTTPVSSPKTRLWTLVITVAAINHSATSPLLFSETCIGLTNTLSPSFSSIKILRNVASNLVLEEFRIMGTCIETKTV
jgi:hypothetical protein